MITIIIRLIFTAIMCYFVYQETGPATTIAVVLIGIAIEVISYEMNLMKKRYGFKK